MDLVAKKGVIVCDYEPNKLLAFDDNGRQCVRIDITDELLASSDFVVIRLIILALMLKASLRSLV